MQTGFKFIVEPALKWPLGCHGSLNILIVLLMLLPFRPVYAECGSDSLPEPHRRHASGGAQSVGLVLSGGGAKGIAHIGVIRALEDAGIPIDFVTGTSMGAIVGGLYSAGYTTDEMLELILSKDFSYWSTGRINPSLRYNFTMPESTPAMFNFSVGGKRDSIQSAVPASLISPIPMNFAFMELFSGFTAQTGGDFDRLMVPFRCVASDVAAHRKVVLDHGSLGDAIRASMSFPAVFQPTEFEGMLLYDGGIYDNFPVDVMRSTFAPDIMIGVDVSSSDSGPQTSLLDQIENLVVQNADYSLPADEGIKIRVDVDRFGLLDFPQAREIYNIGYEKTMSMIDSIGRRVHGRISHEARRLQREVFKSQTPYLRFDSVKVKGATPGQNEYIARLFESRKTSDTIGVSDARDAFYQAVSSGKIRDLGIQSRYDKGSGLFGLDLDASIKDDYHVGIGGWITSSTNSYIYLSAGYSRLSFNSLAADASAWVGQSYMAATVNGRIFLRTGIQTSLALQGVFSRKKYSEDDRFFFEESAPAFVLDYQYFGRLRWCAPAGRSGVVELGAGYGHLYDSFYELAYAQDYRNGRDRLYHDLAQVYLRYTSNTLGSIDFPVSGHNYEASLTGFMGKHRLERASLLPYTIDSGNSKWAQLNLRCRHYAALHPHWSLGIDGDLMLSTRQIDKSSYAASVISAPQFTPTPSSYNSFNPGLRANSYVGIGVVPVYRYNDNVSVRLSANGFVPVRGIVRDRLSETGVGARYGDWFADPQLFCELTAAYAFPFATLSAYANYCTVPAHNWNFGIAFGIFLQAPDFLR